MNSLTFSVHAAGEGAKAVSPLAPYWHYESNGKKNPEHENQH